MTRSYLDNAASTPLVPAAIDAVTAELARVGNASSLHASGRAARSRLEDAREQLASAIGAHPTEVIFTAGGTEADNLALRGSWLARRHERNVVSLSTIEHPAIIEAAGAMSSEGAEISMIEVDDQGVAQLDHLDPNSAVASVMWVNNETGVVNDPAPLVEGAHSVGAWAHSDAVQALGHLPVDFGSSGLDLMTISSHKIGGPVGIGALIARREAGLKAIQFGGGQEREVRSGTLPVALAAGFAVAAELAVAAQLDEYARLRTLADALLAGVANVPGVTVNPTRAETSPAIVNLAFDGCGADDLLLLLDSQGIDCSTGSACTAGVSQPSPVLLAMGHSRQVAGTSLRFSFGPGVTSLDIDHVLKVLPGALSRSRQVQGSSS